MDVVYDVFNRMLKAPKYDDAEGHPCTTRIVAWRKPP